MHSFVGAWPTARPARRGNVRREARSTLLIKPRLASSHGRDQMDVTNQETRRDPDQLSRVPESVRGTDPVSMRTAVLLAGSEIRAGLYCLLGRPTRVRAITCVYLGNRGPSDPETNREGIMSDPVISTNQKGQTEIRWPEEIGGGA